MLCLAFMCIMCSTNHANLKGRMVLFVEVGTASFGVLVPTGIHCCSIRTELQTTPLSIIDSVIKMLQCLCFYLC